MIKQAYINGFIRECASHGIDAHSLLKSAYSNEPNNVPLATAGGTVLGAVIGALRKAENKKDRRRNAILGAIAGGTLGAGSGYINDSVRDRLNDLEAILLAAGKSDSFDLYKARNAINKNLK